MKIDLAGVAEALEYHGEMEWYLDKSDGTVTPVMDGLEEELQEFYEQLDADPGRFLAIEPMDSREGFRIMERFTDGLPDGEARRSLVRALSGRKPFASFKHTLHDFPKDREAWFAYHNECMLEEAQNFLRENDVKFEEG
jgi:hypothetical protein